MNLVFWNINKKSLSDSLVELVNEYEVDILIIAESTSDLILEFLTKQSKINPTRKYSLISESKIAFLTSYDPSIFKQNSNRSPRWTSMIIDIPTIIKMNLFGVHFHSKYNWTDISLSLECVKLANDIDTLENESGIFDTIIMGDFNMNPYESGIVAANGLHALPDLNHIIKSPSGRIIDGINYKYFYNPMWNFFGDKEKPYGTYYYREPGHASREWNIFDQILYRSSLSQYILNGNIKIINKINNVNLVTALDRPDKNSFSDHLPIFISLTI